MKSPVKNLSLTLKLAAVFVVLHLIVLAGTLVLFMRVAGHDLIDDLGRLRAHEGNALALALEDLLQEETESGFESPAIQHFLRQASRAHDLRIELTRDEPPPVSTRPETRPWSPHYHDSEILVGGRRCRVYGAPPTVMWIPVFLDRDFNQAPDGHLILRGPSHGLMIHRAFRDGLLWLALISMLGIVGLAIYVTAPLRRMARSMDRVAAGDLDHRLDGRGSDDVALMGRSFNHMTERIQDMLQRQKELTAAVSHELRSPLARMKMGLELCRDADDPGPRLDAVDREIDHVDQLVGELLAVSRGELGTATAPPEPLPLAQAVRAAWDRSQDPGTSPELVLDLDIPGDLWIAVDPSSAEKIFGNLLRNCLSYADPGPIRVTARPAQKLDGDSSSPGRIDIHLRDSGPGVAPEHLDRLFEPFFRADAARSHDDGHVGLGLMVVERLVAAHGGRIRAVDEAPGLGLCFDLPAATGLPPG